jgi:hypothetical protein
VRESYSKQASAGIWRGYCDPLRAIWALEAPRVDCARQTLAYPPAQLSAIPKPFRRLLRKRVNLSSRWTPKTDHWFDLRRAVRTGRALLDLRVTAQRDALAKHLAALGQVDGDRGQKNARHAGPRTDSSAVPRAAEAPTLGSSLEAGPSIVSGRHQPSSSSRVLAATAGGSDKKPLKVASLARLTLMYFERSLGGGALTLAAERSIHFLEALHQYAQYPLMNFLLRALCPEEGGGGRAPLPESCLWVYSELRALLQQRGLVQKRTFVPRVDPSQVRVGAAPFFFPPSHLSILLFFCRI